MRICIFTENNYRGGLDTFLFNLINSWPNKLDSFTIACNKDHPGLAMLELRLVRTLFVKYNFLFTSKLFHGKADNIILRSKPFRAFFYIITILLEYPIIFPYYILKLYLFFKKDHFDKLLIVNGGYPGSLVCRCASISWYLFTKKKSIFNFHNFSQKSNLFSSFFEKSIDKIVFSKSSYIISVSNVCLNSILNRKVYIEPSKLKVIYNGIEQNKYTKKNEQKKINSYCIMLGTFESRKGHYFMLQAFKLVLVKFPEIKLYIYGEGKEHEKNRILKYINDLELTESVRLNNYINDPFPAIQNSKILLVPSQNFESFGLTSIEAMSLGIPIVATNIGGIPEVIYNSKAGMISDKDDIAAYSNNIIRILSSKTLYDSLSRNGIIYYNNQFKADKMALQYYKFLNHE